MSLLVAVVIGFLLGSIPFGLLLTRLAGLGDIRAIGSGSIGATNVLRTGRKDVAAATLLLDAGKGAAAVWFAQRWGPEAVLLAGVAAVLGHCFNPWLRFRGGKGVATGFGVVLAWAWPVGVACGAIWLVLAFVTRRSSAAALLTVLAAPVLMLIWRDGPAALATLLVAGVIVYRHRENIARLRAGTEPRIGAK